MQQTRPDLLRVTPHLELFKHDLEQMQPDLPQIEPDLLQIERHLRQMKPDPPPLLRPTQQVQPET